MRSMLSDALNAALRTLFKVRYPRMNNIPLVGLYAQYRQIKSEIDSAIERVIEKSQFVGGEEVRLFEEEFAAYCETGGCVGVGNGTDAVYLALRAMGIGSG